MPPTPSRPSLLSVLLLPAHLLPAPALSGIGALALNHFLRGQALAGRLSELDGRRLAIEVTDTGLVFGLRIVGKRLTACDIETADVAIRSDTRGFLDLLLRREDPDTLFFQRRLCIEGDTETGVHIKNLLDSAEFDWGAHLRAVLPGPVAGLAIGVIQAIRAIREAR